MSLGDKRGERKGEGREGRATYLQAEKGMCDHVASMEVQAAQQEARKEEGRAQWRRLCAIEETVCN